MHFSVTYARENVDYWYIKDFDSTIELKENSTAVITEKIIADCGKAKKHGIFRVLPIFHYPEYSEEKVYHPITLISITNFANKPYKYKEIRNSNDQTITWQIGDPNSSVTGVNEYIIKYEIKNVIDSKDNSQSFYWNLNGNFWDLQTDHFTGHIIFPSQINQSNTDLQFFTGTFKSKTSGELKTDWQDNVLDIEYQ
jgi:hypothetical protein